METVCSSETLVPTYKCTCRHQGHQCVQLSVGLISAASNLRALLLQPYAIIIIIIIIIIISYKNVYGKAMVFLRELTQSVVSGRHVD
jgi:hypothetical protein